MSSYFSNGYSWYIQWREDGQTRRAKLGKVTEVSEADAINAAKAKDMELRYGKKILPTGLVFSQFSKVYLGWHSVEYPDSHYRIKQITEKHLRPYFGHFPIDAIPITTVEQYKAMRGSEVAPSTVTKEIRTLKAIINKAVEWGEIVHNPIQHVQSPRNNRDAPPPFYTVEQLGELYTAWDTQAHWWRIMVNTGLRRKEALQVTKDDIAEDSIRVVSREGARTKSGKWRDVPLNNAARESIKEILRGKYLLPRMVPRSLSRCFERDAANAELPGSIHWLRHTYCSHLVMAGVSLRTVQKLAGHSTYRVTERYAHLVPGYLQNEANRICL